MHYLNTVDYTVITIYFLILIGLGIYLKKMASASLDDYFLGGRKLPWWALGVSGMAAFVDMTGTMIITSFLFMLGPRGLFIEFRGGAVLALIPMLLWTGKWHRRSQCMTGAEWMIFRFGEGFGGQFARIISALATILCTVGMLAYAIKGTGLFLSMFLPFSPVTCALIMIAITTLYTMVSGFYGVVVTDMFQSVIILAAVVAIFLLATFKITDYASFAALAHQVTGNKDWTSCSLQWFTTMPKGYEIYKHLALFAMLYLIRNIFGGMSGGYDPKYFGARSDRECGILTFFWTWLMMFRWPMMIGFAVLGIFMIRDLFPDQAVLLQAADLIKHHVGVMEKSQWAGVLAQIMNKPQNYPQELIAGLQKLLGQNWNIKLSMLSFEGTVDPERVLPGVILFDIPLGLRGMILVALIAAEMSTFNSMINTTAAYFTKDLYQRYIRPKAKNSELIYFTWCACVLLVGMGFALAYKVKNINDIWGWIMMGLGGGLLIPGLLRLYWWRFNGGGFAIGTIVGACGAFFQRIMFPSLGEQWQFLILGMVGLTGAIVGTYLTRPTDPQILERFYQKTLPFGLWGHLKRRLPDKVRAAVSREHFYDILALPFNTMWHITLFILPMALTIHAFKAFWLTSIIFVIGLVGMYFFWYKQLPPAHDDKKSATVLMAASQLEAK